MSEKYIASLMGARMLREGADCFGSGVIMIYSGRERETWCDGLPTDYRLKKGDLVQVDGGFAFEGYKSDIIRMACIGKPSNEQKKNYEIAKEASIKSINSIREGISCREVWKEAEKVWKKYGYEDFINGRKKANWCANGHGIGLDIHEPPVISLAEKELLKNGMVITIEAFNTHNGIWPLKKAEWWYVIEDLVLVKKDGYELLSDTMSNDLWIA
jgi:Xaa-Pro aminopeptidase